jgi:hypothetical protein
VSAGGGFDREELARLTERLKGLRHMLEVLSAVARQGIAATDGHVIAEHPELDDLNRELDNTYPTAFDDPGSTA